MILWQKGADSGTNRTYGGVPVIVGAGVGGYTMEDNGKAKVNKAFNSSADV